MEKDKTKITMTMDDLTNALNEHGVNAKKPDYCESYYPLLVLSVSEEDSAVLMIVIE